MKDLVLQGFVKSFADERELSNLSDSEIFEAFSISSLLRKYHCPDVPDLDEVLMGGSGDGGIDAGVILVNGHPISTKDDVQFFVDKLRRLDVEFVFIQAKTSAAFEAASIGNFVYGVEQFFSQDSQIQFRNEVERLRELKNYIYERSIEMEQNPRCSLYFVTAGTWTDDLHPRARLSDGHTRLQQLRLFSHVRVDPIDAERLKTIYRELERGVIKEIEFSRTTVFPRFEGVREAYLGLLSGDQFLNLIVTEEGNLNRELFYDNVRDFQGNNSVNQEIASTLSSEETRSRFALLNNGVTIVARSINRTGDVFKISDFQIVNGCQTTHILFQNREVIDTSSYIPIKLIVTDDSQIITEVIKATNRQTAVLPESLESLTPFHKELEDFYLGQQSHIERQQRILYERRSKQYAFDRIKPSNIVTLTAQTKSFVAMFLNEPHSHPRYYGELLNSYEQRLFVNNHNPAPYYASGYTFLTVERFFNNGKFERYLRKYKYHISMLIRIQVSGLDIPKFNSNRITQYSLDIVKSLEDEKLAFQHCDKAINIIKAGLKNFNSYRSDPSQLRAFTRQIIDSLRSDSSKLEPSEDEPSIDATEQGKILWYNDVKNFGFIERDKGGDLFVHRTELSKIPWHLRCGGTRVTFTVVQGRDSGTLMAGSVTLDNPQSNLQRPSRF